MSPKTFLSMICPDFARGQSQASLFNLSDIVIPNEVTDLQFRSDQEMIFAHVPKNFSLYDLPGFCPRSKSGLTLQPLRYCHPERSDGSAVRRQDADPSLRDDNF